MSTLLKEKDTSSNLYEKFSDRRFAEKNEIGIVPTNVNREINTALHFNFKRNGEKVIEISKEEFHRIQNREIKEGDQFAHFNMGGTNNKINNNYALVLIEQPGYKKNGKEKKPLLSPYIYKVMCVSKSQNVSYNNIDEECFNNTLYQNLNIGKNKVHDLKSIVVSKYLQSTNLTEDEIIANGVAITHFRLESSNALKIKNCKENVKNKDALLTNQ